MPHLILDYSPNLRETGDLAGLCGKLARTLVDFRADGKPVYPIGGVRVRAFAADACCIGDGSLADAAYVHAALRVGAGRDAPTREATCHALFDVIKAHFAAIDAARPLALSLEASEFGEAGTLKHNNLHEIFRKQLK
ncbi:MAG: 5-carboxymethyl-2-hydroxymuconate isomerase [Burkholderiales bacterium]|nr:5-carboxymethyl-2-hydroxymuconate isomerase [Burkholderiales bacterium]